MASPLADLFDVRFITLELTAREKIEAIREVASLLEHSGAVADFPGFSRELIARDELSSTAMGNGVAFPHARTDCVGEILLAIGRSEAGVDFGSERVQLVFVIGTPRSKITEYLVVVGALARMLKRESLRVELMAARTPADFIACLRD